MKATTCPICGRRLAGQLSDWPQLPFCSPKCRTIDLGRWLSESYRVPAEEPEEEDPQDDADHP
jgi:endogenous inhibitor of DNA gyrase (YacG/DUF329 family)